MGKDAQNQIVQIQDTTIEKPKEEEHNDPVQRHNCFNENEKFQWKQPTAPSLAGKKARRVNFLITHIDTMDRSCARYVEQRTKQCFK